MDYDLGNPTIEEYDWTSYNWDTSEGIESFVEEGN